MRRLPDFFIVGAQKAGTTTLHDWLTQQPDACLPTIKETHFFSHDDRYAYGIEWYLRQFPACDEHAVVGEIDPEYMYFKDAPLRMLEWVKTPKIVFLLRNPIDRAYSHYQMSVRRGYETLSFEDALRKEPGRLAADKDGFAHNHQSYMGRGRYCEQISRFREAFPKSEFLFVKFDELVGKKTGAETYAHICRFIGLKSSPTIADRSKKSNQASLPRSVLLRDFLYKPDGLRKRLSKLIPSVDVKMRLSLFLDWINQRPLKANEKKGPATMPAEILRDVKEEIIALETETNLKLRDWLDAIETLSQAQPKINRIVEVAHTSSR